MDQIEASVAPPRLITSTLGISFLMRLGKGSGIQSPLKRAKRRQEELSSSGWGSVYSTSICKRAGTEFQIVTRSRTSISNQEAGLRMASAAGITMVPPAAN